MNYRFILLFFIMFISSFVIDAQEQTEEITSENGKTVKIRYSVKRYETYADVKFEEAYVEGSLDLKLLFAISRKCNIPLKRGSKKDLKEIVVCPNKTEIDELSNDEYHVLNDNSLHVFNDYLSKITIRNLDSKEDSLKVPVYLAEYEKSKFNLIDLCHLSIKIPKMVSSVKSNQKQTVLANQDNQGVYFENDNGWEEDDGLVEDVDSYDLLPLGQDEEQKILEKQKEERNTIENINNHLKEAQLLIDNPESSLKDLKEMDSMLYNDITKIENINSTHPLLEKLKSRRKLVSTRIDEIEKQEEESSQKRTIWMIIGGIILAILGFVGNQAFQHYRNVRNEKNMMSMQQSIVRRAEDEAKRRAQSMARQKVNQVQNAARRKSQDYVRGSINSGISKISKGKKNKGFSI